MISTTYANNILTYLFSQSYKSYTTATTLFIGLCANSPKEDGSLAEADEPDTDKTGYERLKLITHSTSTSGSGSQQQTYHSITSHFFGPPKDGKISNSIHEIKFNAAQKDWGKMTYWFISTTETVGSGSAILWGTIKDIIQEEQTITVPINGEEQVSFEHTYEGLVTFQPNVQYIVNFNNNDYKIVSTEKIQDKDNICLDFNCLNAINDLDKDHPFKIRYWTTGNPIDGFQTHYKITAYVKEDERELETITRKFGIFGIGINIKRNTVPTFFKDQLTAEIKISEE